MSSLKCSTVQPISYLRQQQAAKIDEELFSRFGFRVEQLMELAGLACAKAVEKQYPARGNVLVLCGPGNNGGDGFVCARHLQMFGYNPSVVYPRESKNGLMRALVQQCQGMDIDVLKSLPDLKSVDLVVDALFGFSFRPPVRAPFDEIITNVNASGKPIFSVDIPSGWDVEEGTKSATVCFSPSAVISLTAPKLCMQEFTGSHFLGGRFLPRQLIEEYNLNLPEYAGAEQIVKL